MARCKHCKGKGKQKCDNCSKTDKLNKELLKVLKFVAKKRAKKRAKKQGKTLAEYSKDKMLMDLHTKSLMGSGGGPVGLRVGNLDSEMIKKDINDIKEKQGQHTSFINRAMSGMDQYNRQMQIEHKQLEAPRDSYEMGDILMIEELPEMLAANAELEELREKNAQLEAEKLKAELSEDMDGLEKIEEQQAANQARARRVTKEKQHIYYATRRAKQQAERDQERMFEIQQRQLERDRIAEEKAREVAEKKRLKEAAEAEKARARDERKRVIDEKKLDEQVRQQAQVHEAEVLEAIAEPTVSALPAVSKGKKKNRVAFDINA